MANVSPVLQRFPELAAKGLLFIDSNEQYVLKAADGSEVCIGLVGEDEQAAIRYLEEFPTPDVW